jgi:hypothetical protein
MSCDGLPLVFRAINAFVFDGIGSSCKCSSSYIARDLHALFFFWDHTVPIAQMGPPLNSNQTGKIDSSPGYSETGEKPV